MSPERLQKVLASAGIASRRDCEALITAGRVAVNGKVVRILGTRIDPEQDVVTIDGQPVGQAQPRTYVMLHKPVGVVSTAEDTHDRPTVVDLVDLPARLFPVGRLDQESEGLLLLTDDGALTQRLTHPSFEVEKEYRALLDQPPTQESLREWRAGVELDGVRTAPAWIELQERADEGTWIRVVLHEGRKRQIREVAKLLGYEVLRLIRVREGPLTLGDLSPGAWRQLTDEEVTALWEHVGGQPSDDELLEAPFIDERAERPSRPHRSENRAEADTEGRGQFERPSRRDRPANERNERNDRPLRDDSRDYRRQDQSGYRSRDARGPARQGFGGRDNRGGRVQYDNTRRDDRSYGNTRRDDRPYDNTRRDDRSYGNTRRDDRPYDNTRRDDRSYGNTRRDDRPYDNTRRSYSNDRPRDSFRGSQRDDQRGPRDFRRNEPSDRGNTGRRDWPRDDARGQRRDYGRDQRGGDYNRGPDRNNADRPPQRRAFNDDRPPRRDFNDRPPQRRAFNDDRPPRRDFNDRSPRRDFNNRPPRDRQYGSDRPYRDDRSYSDTRPPRDRTDRTDRPRGDRDERRTDRGAPRQNDGYRSAPNQANEQREAGGAGRHQQEQPNTRKTRPSPNRAHQGLTGRRGFIGQRSQKPPRAQRPQEDEQE